MEHMVSMADNSYDIAIVDPPYGIDDKLMHGDGFGGYSKARKDYAKRRWDTRPGAEYFRELFRVSKNQIIWGGNYFMDYLPPSRGIIAWVKPQMKNHPSFSQFELAWTSFDKPAKCVYTYETQEPRTHPTQKPVRLYEWILYNYVEPGWSIIDTHLGSGTAAVAASRVECNFVGIEIDPDYVAQAGALIDDLTRQQRLPYDNK